MNGSQKKGLGAIVGAVAAASLLSFTPAWEGTELTTYSDIGNVLTYCTGATENAQWGKTYTPEQCRAQLDRDLERHAAGIAKCVQMDRLTVGQRIAFTDIAFNIGVSAFCGSSMARRANAGDMRGSCDALLMWDKVGGKQVRGLTRRRQAEREICLKGLP